MRTKEVLRGKKGDVVLYTGKICDTHMHVYDANTLNTVVRRINGYGYDRYALLSTSGGELGARGIVNAVILLQKLRDPGRAYAFAGLEHPDRGTASAEELLAQVKMYHRMGFDGLKMLEGKPNYRIRTAQALDSDVYEPVYAYLEENGLPLLAHVNDPRYFWDKSKMTPWQISMGWYAGDDCLPFETVRAEALAVARRHPRLRIVYAHFFFASASVQEADEILDAYPNVSFDLTPGIFYMEMAANRGVWREFFLRRADRLLFGTDFYDAAPEAHVPDCRRMLETDDSFVFFDVPVQGFALPDTALERIYRTNFERFAGSAPRPVPKAEIPAFLAWESAGMEGKQNAAETQAALATLSLGFEANK